MLKNLKLQHFHLLKSCPFIHIRLHPTISKSNVLKLLIQQNIYNTSKLIFIDNSETIDSTILSSKYCIFSESNILNRAISLKAKIIVFKGSFLYDPPMYNSEMIF